MEFTGQQVSQQSDPLLEKIRQQFDFGPYPRVPLDATPKDDIDQLYVHSFATPYYLRHQRTVPSEGLTILDVGCGSGYKSLILALANPGAKIVGVDISPQSIALSRQRLQHHGIENAEFFELSAFDVAQLGLQFDYINCDEVLYLLNPAAALAAMKSVLKPHGIIRSNLHSALQRASYFRAQELFGKMGLMDENPEDLEIEIVGSVLSALKDEISLKKLTWTESKAEDPEYILCNFLLQGDKGYRVADLFRVLEQSDLEFLSMTNWREWDLASLFKDPEELPLPLAFGLSEASIEERLTLYELINPAYRLLDFWCGHPEAVALNPVADWSAADWQSSCVMLHPALKTEKIRDYLLACVSRRAPVTFTEFIKKPLPGRKFEVEAILASILIPLWEGRQPFMNLVERFLKVQPVDPITLEPVSAETAFETVKGLIESMETYLLALVELAE